MSTALKFRQVWAPYSREVDKLPPGWGLGYKKDSYDIRRCYFESPDGKEITHSHPVLGSLPHPWVLVVHPNSQGAMEINYYNRTTKRFTKKDPRNSVDTGSSNLKRYQHGTSIESAHRAEVQKVNMQSDYEVVHVIDDGKGGLGGMNGGVKIVRKKGQTDELLVEKIFAPREIKSGAAKNEIDMLRRCRHMALTLYHGAFITETPPLQASVYVEFCDRGSLADLMDVYKIKRQSDPTLYIGEGFIWHAIMGLFDALAYLQTGGRYCGSAKKDPDPNWKPILHRDIKPDNVFLRSRTWASSTKPIYCVLSDFGLACEQDNPDWVQKGRYTVGSNSFWAPELLYDPIPRTQYERDHFPNGFAHSPFTDCWALGATIYCLCKANAWAHFDPQIRKVDASQRQDHLSGTKLRKQELRIDDCYTDPLRDALLQITVWDPDERPDAETAAKYLYNLWNTQYKDGIGNKFLATANLPDWATSRHSYKADTSTVRTGKNYSKV